MKFQLGFSKPDILAATGTATTGASVGVSFFAQAMPFIQFGAAVIGAMVGIATLTYYILAIVEKVRILRNKK